MTKKLLFGTMAAVTMLFASSCSNELDVVTPAEGEATVSVSLNIPELQMGSRAFSDGTTARKLQYEVYEVMADGNLNKLEMGGENDEFILKDEISFRLLNDHSYKFVFWASTLSSDSPYTVNFEEKGATVTADYTNVSANDENLDAFFATKDLAVTGSTKLDVELYRPFAQINIGSNDLADMTKEEHTVTGVEVKVSDVYTKLDLISGHVSDAKTVTFASAGLPTGETFPVAGYDYLAMNYVLVGQEGENDEAQKLVTVEFTATNEKGETNTRKVGSVPVQRNYRTNIYGQLFTSDLEWDVVIEPGYEKPDFNGQYQLASTGGTVVLEEDVEIKRTIVYQSGNTSTIDLNGHTITFKDSYPFDVRDNTTLIIKGDGKVISTSDASEIIIVYSTETTAATLIIEGGEFETTRGDMFRLWCGDEQVTNGSIYIKGGTFKSTFNGNKNYIKSNPEEGSTATVEVTGGKFYDWDPSKYVKEGYKAEEVTIDDERWFVVVPEGTRVVTAENAATVNMNGGDFLIIEDVKSEKGVTLTKETSIDLDGHSLDAVSNGNYGDNMVVGNGATVTISNGEIKPAEEASQANQSATIMIKTAYESHLTLNDVKVTGFYPIYLNSANENSTVTINGGEFYPALTNNPAVYVGKGSSGSTIGGKVTINGGVFGQKGVTYGYLLNVEDVLRNQAGKEPRDFIEVFGGTFINFNPADCDSEGPHTNFVAEGYMVVSEKVGEDTYYTVVKK